MSDSDYTLEEYLRSARFPGIVFTTAPGGWRVSKVLGGLDVWEYVFIARQYEGNVGRTAEHLGQPETNVRLSLAYHAAYPDEADAHLRYPDTVAADPIGVFPHARILKV